MCYLLSYMGFANSGPAWGSSQVLVRTSSTASSVCDLCQADLSFPLSALSLCWKFSVGNTLGDEELSLLYCKIQEKIFLETNTVPTYIAQGLFPIFTSKSCLCRGRNASSHSHLFEINTVTFTNAVITLGRDASNPRIYDLSSTWGEASECISFNTWPFATVIQFKTVGVSLRSD